MKDSDGYEVMKDSYGNFVGPCVGVNVMAPVPCVSFHEGSREKPDGISWEEWFEVQKDKLRRLVKPSEVLR